MSYGGTLNCSHTLYSQNYPDGQIERYPLYSTGHSPSEYIYIMFDIYCPLSTGSINVCYIYGLDCRAWVMDTDFSLKSYISVCFVVLINRKINISCLYIRSPAHQKSSSLAYQSSLAYHLHIKANLQIKAHLHIKTHLYI